ERTPDLSLLPAGTPTSIRRLLRRCFEKNPRERLPDAATARLEIMDALAPVDAERSAPRVTAIHWWQQPAVLIISVFGLVALAVAAFIWKPTPNAVGALTRLALVLPRGDTFGEATADDATFDDGLALSPDGRTIVYAAHRAGRNLL